MPFSAVQAIQNVKRNASLKRGPSSPEVGLGPDSEFIELQTELVQELQLEIAHHKIAVHREHDGLVISLREVGFSNRVQQ